MPNSGPLVPLGIAVIVISLFAIAVPYLRHRSDALTAWNLVLLGGILFIGVGSLAVVYGDFHWPELKWFQPNRSDVTKYILGTIAFYGTLFFTYFYLAWPKRVAARFLNKWPPLSLPLLVVSLGAFGALAAVATVTHGEFFIGPLLFNMSHKALIFAVVFSFYYWYQNKRQVVLLLLFLGVFVLASLDAMVIFRGRRLLLSVAVAPLICMYWLHWRNLPPGKILIRLAVAGVIALSVATFYNAFRHYNTTGGSNVERTFAGTVDAMTKVSARDAVADVMQNAFFYFAQYCGHYSLLTIQLVDAGQIEVQPLHTLKFLASYPIPRTAWPNKPQALGFTIVRAILRLPYNTNWGLGIVGNGYHEGGIPVIMLYAVLMVLGIRLLDDALRRQPNNVFLIGILSASAPHFAALIRGDPTTMAAEIIEAYAFGWGLGLVLRMFFGTAVVVGPRPTAQPHQSWGGQARELSG